MQLDFSPRERFFSQPPGVGTDVSKSNELRPTDEPGRDRFFSEPSKASSAEEGARYYEITDFLAGVETIPLTGGDSYLSQLNQHQTNPQGKTVIVVVVVVVRCCVSSLEDSQGHEEEGRETTTETGDTTTTLGEDLDEASR